MIVAGDNNVEPPIIAATRKNNIDLVRMLLEGGAYSKEAYVNEQKVSVSPLHIAVQNQNYEMIEMLCQYYGAEVDDQRRLRYDIWISAPQRKFSLSDVFKTIGAHQDLEALKIVLPFAAHSSYKIPFSPRVFPELIIADIDFMVSIEGASISWPVNMISQMYSNDKNKCYAMLQQGCELEVVDFFIEKCDYAFFEKAISHHRGIRPRPSFGAVYDRGGEWYTTLEKASPPEFKYMVLRQDRDKYLAKLIRAEKFHEFKSAVKAMGISFPVDALDAFCNYPKDGTITEEMQAFFDYVLEHCEYSERLDHGCTGSDAAFRFYAETLLCNASIETVQRYLSKYPHRIMCEDKVFIEKYRSLVEYRQDDAFVILLKMKLAYDSERTPGKDWARYSNFATFRQKTIYEVFTSIMFHYSSKEFDLKHDFSWRDKDKAKRLATRWQAALHHFVQIVPIEEIDRIISENKCKRYKNEQTALEYALAARIQSEEVLSLLRQHF